MKSRISPLASLTLALLLLTSTAALGQAPGKLNSEMMTEWFAVQQGPDAPRQIVEDYEPGRVLVKFTANAVRNLEFTQAGKTLSLIHI